MGSEVIHRSIIKHVRSGNVSARTRPLVSRISDLMAQMISKHLLASVPTRTYITGSTLQKEKNN